MPDIAAFSTRIQAKITLLACLLLLCIASVHAENMPDVYKCIGVNGKIIYQDEPCDGKPRSPRAQSDSAIPFEPAIEPETATPLAQPFTCAVSESIPHYFELNIMDYIYRYGYNISKIVLAIGVAISLAGYLIPDMRSDMLTLIDDRKRTTVTYCCEDNSTTTVYHYRGYWWREMAAALTLLLCEAIFVSPDIFRNGFDWQLLIALVILWVPAAILLMVSYNKGVKIGFQFHGEYDWYDRRAYPSLYQSGHYVIPPNSSAKIKTTLTSLIWLGMFSIAIIICAPFLVMISKYFLLAIMVAWLSAIVACFIAVKFLMIYIYLKLLGK